MYLCGGCPPAPAAGQLPLFTRTPPRAKGEFRRMVEGVSTHPQAGGGAVMGKAVDRLARSPTDGCTRGGKQASCSVEREQGRRIKGVPKTATPRSIGGDTVTIRNETTTTNAVWGGLTKTDHLCSPTVLDDEVRVGRRLRRRRSHGVIGCGHGVDNGGSGF